LKLTYLGHAGVIVESDGHRIAIDPFLSGNPLAVMKPDEVQVDTILLTHGHSDHIADAEAIARSQNALIIAPVEVAEYFGKKGLKVHPMNLGGSYSFPFGTVKMTLAFHSSSIETPEGTLYGGNPAGYLLTMGDRTLYHAGDTALFGDMQWIGKLNTIDLALLPIGDNFTMGPEDAVIAAEWIGAKRVVPIHYNTFGLIRQDPEAFANAVQAKGMEPIVMAAGDMVQV
jgi:L-ascorbate metabolism protein UlaG (beta-lactamase superfamily)